ncbi:MAG: hypothetical protein KGI13_08235 [Betaproteobacteria bacterium]|nr:hypothetical protein [Betaproteobacteria bacterium]
MDAEITLAIESRKMIAFIYEGHSRTVEPYCFGIDKKGNKAIRAFQVGGGSNSGSPQSWKLFLIADIRGLNITNTNFAENRMGYKRNDSAFDRIFSQI